MKTPIKLNVLIFNGRAIIKPCMGRYAYLLSIHYTPENLLHLFITETCTVCSIINDNASSKAHMTRQYMYNW